MMFLYYAQKSQKICGAKDKDIYCPCRVLFSNQSDPLRNHRLILLPMLSTGPVRRRMFVIVARLRRCFSLIH